MSVICAQAMEDSLYELDSPKSFGSPSLRREDWSYGITVTKVLELARVTFVLTVLQVVERLEDPVSIPVITP